MLFRGDFKGGTPRHADLRAVAPTSACARRMAQRSISSTTSGRRVGLGVPRNSYVQPWQGLGGFMLATQRRISPNNCSCLLGSALGQLVPPWAFAIGGDSVGQSRRQTGCSDPCGFCAFVSTKRSPNFHCEILAFGRFPHWPPAVAGGPLTVEIFIGDATMNQVSRSGAEHGWQR